jgi:RND family efflux transporter MFP subunit
MNTQDQDLTVESTSFKRRQTGIAAAWAGSSAALAGLVMAGIVTYHEKSQATAAPAALPIVAVAEPVQRDLDSKLTLLGQYSAVEKVDLRAQVGGTLTQINFKDGDVVHKGDLLFVIDAEPYQIKLSQAQAKLAAANARLDLANRQLVRAETLKATDAGSAENVEQRAAEELSAKAAVDGAQAEVRDARFDVDHTRVTAPFTGRINNHQVSVGSLVAGSRAGTGDTTLLSTIVSTDAMYLDFDMSEANYTAYVAGRGKEGAQKVEVSQGDTGDFSREGTLNFIDNALDRSSGTIHVRATVPNNNFDITPGGFAHVRLSMSKAAPVLLVPDASVLPDQANHVVLTVGKDGVVVAKQVELGELRGGLRVIQSGLVASDDVVIDNIPSARPGLKVTPHAGAIAFAEESPQPQQVSSN